MKKILLALLGIWVMVSAMAAEAPFKDGVPDTYTVKKGDTLWDISAYFLSKPWLWPEIWHVNPQIANPHLIYPGDTLNLVYIDGKPRLVLNRAGSAQASGRTVKLSPQIRESAHREPIPALPLDMVNSFLTRTRVVDSGVLEAAPYVLAGEEKRVLSGLGDDFYARGDFSDKVGFYGVYRDGGLYIDPKTNEVLGIRAKDIGSAKLKLIDGDIGTFGVTRSRIDIRFHDRLLPDEERKIDTTFHPSQPPQGTEGIIIRVEGNVRNGGLLDVVAINLGNRDNIQTGNMMAIYKAGEVVRDRIQGGMVTLPPARAGVLMIFRTFEKMSFGLILNANKPLSVDDMVKNP
ncbi:MAG: peptidoglycan-binding protein [Gammaproteobacteria bacterium]|nr:MAG: peptidoglycan-binding protein [Gammaproteobacteria bacterium]